MDDDTQGRSRTSGATEPSASSDASPRLSLLHPAGRDDCRPANAPRLYEDCARDLGLATLAAGLTPDTGDRGTIETILSSLCQDAEVIRYRQDVLQDILDNPETAGRLADLMPAIVSLGSYGYRFARDRNTLQEVIWRLGELANYVECVQGLAAIFAGAGDGIRSQGLRELRATIDDVAAGEAFQNLARELPGLLGQLRSTASVTIGINLNQHLQPIEAVLLSVNDRKFKAKSFLNRILGREGDGWEGIAPLHGLPNSVTDGGRGFGPGGATGSGFTPMMVPLFRDLAMVLDRSAQPIATALRRYRDINGAFLAGLRQELPFYLGAARLIHWAGAHGLPMCRPQIAPLEERICRVDQGFNLDLALHLDSNGEDQELAKTIVTNDVSFGPEGCIIILTGPNQGGKTTYIQGIGLTQVMAQAGLYVPGKNARISPVDGLYSHFPTEEKLEQATGRFGDEARRLQEMFARITRHSLVLLNESLSSTSAGESLYLGQDIVRILRLLGARAIFSTHLHELAAGVDELNASEPGDSRIISMVASPVHEGVDGPVQNRFHIVPGPPMGRSYAREIASRYGVSYEQLRTLLDQRGVLRGGERNEKP